MPSSITLSVVFTDESEAKLREVMLREPWQDMMKGMTFSSPKPSMDMEDITMQVESYVENVFEQRFARQLPGVQIQVQIYALMNEARTQKFKWRDPVDQCVKSGDTVVMGVNAIPIPLQQQKEMPEFSDEFIEQVRSRLRFGLNDRVVCFCGPRHFSGHIVGTAVPDDEDLLPYLVKTDPLPGLPTRTISVPSDKDEICVQEVCFDPATQLDLVRAAASLIAETRKPKLRFALGDKVACRIRNTQEDGLENWVTGSIGEIWPKIGEAAWDIGGMTGKFPDIVPYKIELASGWVYCHRDDHTLIRREGMQPITRVKGISKRIEHVTVADGSKFCIDHVTGRRKRLLEDLSDSD